MDADRPYDHAALWLKARVFINRSFEALDQERFDEAALWAAFALELLGKAALSKVNPLLIAEPNDDAQVVFDALFAVAAVGDDGARCPSGASFDAADRGGELVGVGRVADFDGVGRR